ncbi:MAG: hypothetical protein IJH36_07225 [Clostridia bacterium]|nr:hypothetical protein [Clostridia bacterium]MBQ3462890.1 hypothetical protein [Clostridia bacterium]MBQ6529633.1 hypothetical protein [Clostridia bacterium]
MTQKKLFIILLAILTVAVTTVLSIAAFSVSTSNAAREDVAREAKRLSEMTDVVNADIKNVKNELGTIEAELSTSDTVNNYYMEYKKTHDSLTQEISELKGRLEALDNELETRRQENGKGVISGTKTGKKYTLNANESYSCPDKIPAGRYTAKGGGTLTIINSAGQTRVSQNLSVAYDNSYTFNLSEKEKLQVTDSVTLTELK